MLPDYISEMIFIRETGLNLRTGNKKVLIVPKTRLKTKNVAAPKT